MARTNVAAVQLVIQTSLTSDQITAFIEDAHVWVNAHLDGVCAALNEATLTVIEKYLTAYLITVRDPRLTSGRHDDVQESYQRDGEVSEYLKIAAGLDPCGIIEEAFMPGEGKRRVQWRVGAGFDENLELPSSSS